MSDENVIKNSAVRLTEKQFGRLDKYAKKVKRKRAAVIRLAIEEYLDNHDK
jgi:predicted DNA-binding protein